MYKNKINFIAEIGCNHQGDFDLAKKYIDVASQNDIKIVKFQKRNNKYLLKENYFLKHPVPENSFGINYGEHRDYLEFNLKEHKQLKKYCEKRKILYSTSVWDKISAKEISSLNPKFIKIPSARNLDFDIYKILFKFFKGEIHVSLGMTTKKETKKIFDFFKKNKKEKKLVFYCCTSSYPTKSNDTCYLELLNIFKQYGKKISSIGYSGHHKGVAIDNAIYCLGMFCEKILKLGKFRYLERHFTLDRTLKGTDHAASLEPQGIKRLLRDLTNTRDGFSFKKKDILDEEVPIKKKLKY
jgi:sialic acid synthase